MDCGPSSCQTHCLGLWPNYFSSVGFSFPNCEKKGLDYISVLNFFFSLLKFLFIYFLTEVTLMTEESKNEIPSMGKGEGWLR